MALHKDHKISIPDGAHINGDKRVFVFNKVAGQPVRKSKRTYIGTATDDGFMYPNDNFYFIFPKQNQEAVGEEFNIPKYTLDYGLYATTLAIADQSNLYSLLRIAFGDENANALLDYAMFSIKTKSNSNLNFDEAMKDQVNFSYKQHDDPWYEKLFSQTIKDDQILDFLNKWLKQCKKKDRARKVWICVDGSISDCILDSAELATNEHKHTNIVSYIYAIDAKTSMPLTYDLYQGSKMDSLTFNNMISDLKAHNIEISGVILDSEFCLEEVINLLKSLKLDYVIKLKPNVLGYTYMLNKYGAKIKWNVKYSTGKSFFATTEEHPIFENSNSNEPDYISFYFDAVSDPKRINSLNNKIVSCIEDVSNCIQQNKPYIISEDLTKYISVVTDQDGNKTVQCNYEQWQNDVDHNDFFAIASSMHLNANEMFDIYQLCNASKVQYSWSKDQIGIDAMRSNLKTSVKNNFLTCFIASIIRTYIDKSCKALELSSSQMIHSLEKLKLYLLPSKNYVFVDQISSIQKKFFNEFNLSNENFEYIASEVNGREILKNKNILVRRLREVTKGS